jgi:hypothetical protein
MVIEKLGLAFLKKKKKNLIFNLFSLLETQVNLFLTPKHYKMNAKK